MKHIMQIILEENEYNTRSYTGRGMNSSCLAANFDGNIGKVMYDIIKALELAFEDDYSKVSEVADAVREMKTDSMGKGSIIYFPSISYSKDEEEEDNSEEWECK